MTKPTFIFGRGLLGLRLVDNILDGMDKERQAMETEVDCYRESNITYRSKAANDICRVWCCGHVRNMIGIAPHMR